MNIHERSVAIVRHGELYNPENIVYTRDSLMKPDDIMHLSEEGKMQMKQLAEFLKMKDLSIVRIHSSPETRTQESSQIGN